MKENIHSGPKNRTCLNIDNFATISVRKSCNMSKFQNALERKR